MEPNEAYEVRVLIFSASLGKSSLNDRLAALAAEVAGTEGAIVDRAYMVDFDCPSYSPEVEREAGFPPGAEEFRRRLAKADAFMISSPEYNFSMPGMLKTLIDWVSRYRPQPFKAKHGLLMSASPSMAGGNRGLWALRQPLEHLGAPLYPDMFSLAQAHKAFADDGRIADDKLQKWFEVTLKCFLHAVEATKHYPRIKTQWVEFLGEMPDQATERVQEQTQNV